MICRQCANAITGKSQDDGKMAAQGYRVCKAAQSEVERAKYVSGEMVCSWPDRFVTLTKARR